jgi:hypothetical protein
MPVYRKMHADMPEEQNLRAELVDELRGKNAAGGPEIIIDCPNPFTTHLYVIWEKWKGLEQIVRSRIILDAYTETEGDKEATKVTIAMGLTQDEADRLGIRPAA